MLPKPLKLFVFVAPLLLLLVWVPQALAGQVKLAWNAPTQQNGLAGYRLYSWPGTATPPPSTRVLVYQGQLTTYTDTRTELVAGSTHSYAVVAYDTAGRESAYSNVLPVTIPLGNQVPTAGADTASTTAGTSTPISVLANDTDADGNALTITSVTTQGTKGTVTYTSSSVTYTPVAGFVGQDTFKYTISDGRGGTATAEVTVNVLAGNQPPVAIDDTISVSVGIPRTIMVLVNDSDPNATNTLTITAVTKRPGSQATVTYTSSSVTYISATVGPDSFDYTISDGQGASATAKVTVTVLPGRAASLVAAYNFNEGTGSTVSDRSGRNHTGTIRGATWTTAGKFGGALQFDGVDDWVTVLDTPALRLTAMTLSAWVFPTAITGRRDILLKEGTNVDIYNLYARNENGLPEANVFIGGTNRTAQGGALAANVWTHVAGTYDGAIVRLFINGVEVASRAASGTIATSTGPLRIGGNSMWGEFFQGRIDDVRIYNTLLIPTEIKEDMSTPIGTNRVPLAVADTTSVTAGTSTTIPVLVNDSDADGNTLTITAVTKRPGSQATVTYTSSSVTYSSATVGPDSFDYTISDGQGASATAKVTVTVLPGRAASLVAAYNFNEGTGSTVSDRSGRNHTGTIRGATWTTAGKFGGALQFDGVDDWVTVLDTPALRLTAMTLSAWVFPTAITGKRDILLKEGTNVDIYNLYARNENGLPEANVFIGGTNRTAQGGALAANVWTHVAGTYDGAIVRLFINGVEVASRAASGTIATSTGPLRIGGNSMWGEFFQGRIDDVRIYNTVLTPAEIQEDRDTSIK